MPIAALGAYTTSAMYVKGPTTLQKSSPVMQISPLTQNVTAPRVNVVARRELTPKAPALPPPDPSPPSGPSAPGPTNVTPIPMPPQPSTQQPPKRYATGASFGLDDERPTHEDTDPSFEPAPSPFPAPRPSPAPAPSPSFQPVVDRTTSASSPSVPTPVIIGGVLALLAGGAWFAHKKRWI